jgi:hypothetical protein
LSSLSRAVWLRTLRLAPIRLVCLPTMACLEWRRLWSSCLPRNS